jgi:lysozyme
MPKINDSGLALVKEFEGLKLVAYWDNIGNVWTIGYGHTGGVTRGLVITPAQADAFLQNDLEHAGIYVSRYVETDLTPNQFAALCSLVFNVGPSTLIGTNFIRNINDCDWEAAANGFLLFCHGGGKVVQGLLNRREAERKLFLTP